MFITLAKRMKMVAAIIIAATVIATVLVVDKWQSAGYPSEDRVALVMTAIFVATGLVFALPLLATKIQSQPSSMIWRIH